MGRNIKKRSTGLLIKHSKAAKNSTLLCPMLRTKEGGSDGEKAMGHDSQPMRRRREEMVQFE